MTNDFIFTKSVCLPQVSIIENERTLNALALEQQSLIENIQNQ